MAELNSSAAGNGKKSARRTKKPVPRVDLTAMVDLAFLLITFFMLTTTLAKNRVSPVVMPDDEGVSEPVTASSTMTVCLGKDNKVMWYLGEAQKPLLSP